MEMKMSGKKIIQLDIRCTTTHVTSWNKTRWKLRKRAKGALTRYSTFEHPNRLAFIKILISANILCTVSINSVLWTSSLQWVRECPTGVKSCFWAQGKYKGQGKLLFDVLEQGSGNYSTVIVAYWPYPS